MTTQKARIITNDKRLRPSLPATIVEIDEALYLDIDSAIQTMDFFNRKASWRDYLFFFQWLWHYNQHNTPKYYAPALETVLVNWGISVLVNRQLCIKASWEEIADKVFTESMGESARFPIHYGTYNVAKAAYFCSYFDLTTKNLPNVKDMHDKRTFEDILSQQLATTDIFESNNERKSPHYKTYGLYQRITQPFRG